MIYADNSATTKPYDEVIDAYAKVAKDYFANPSSLHKLGGEAEKLLTHARNQIGDLLGVKAKEIVFTSGGTEGNNFALKGTAFTFGNRGNHIITTTVEHDSVHGSLQQLEDMGFNITYVPVDSEGRVSVNAILDAITPETILVSVMHVNNEVGTVQPVEEIGLALQNHPKILFHVDSVQGIGKVPINLKLGYIDLCTFSAHKFHGVKGAGILYIREGISLSPLLSGGAQEHGHRAGTENVGSIVAMAKALRMTFEHNQETLRKMSEEFRKELSSYPDFMINTPKDGAAPHIVNVTIPGMKAEVVIHSLENENVYASTTSACSSKTAQPSKTLLAMGKSLEQASQAIRFSFSYCNNPGDGKKAAQALYKTISHLKKVVR
ncbi:cysteine desulfurase [Priestia filamentosa]|uniref:cysteine desulfurase family protein n=1 Tax=Priestia filamentosa TaxID=1402861 RepID=UPI001FB36F8A|nr:cysteine desulfurase family protein [Priestia filamentosa]MED3725620.1 cysteine desulfurase family protein [Priestia filamentosa]UOE61138.1 cysteine desulfurase [Priestia filamentosa]